MNNKTTGRVTWLDGLRGLAALQVVLLHYSSAFVPAIGLGRLELARYGWERYFIRTPLFFFFDGYSAVYVFFILSGVALTYSFAAAPMTMPHAVLRRIVRLGIPMAGALLFGAVLLALVPGVHLRASAVTRSDWLAASNPVVSLTALAHQVALEGMLAGYGNKTLLPSWLASSLDLAPMGASFDVPLWTLHLEFYGSLLVFALVALRDASSRLLHLLASLLVALAFSTSPLCLFVLGHLATPWLRFASGRVTQSLLGIGLVLVGIMLCTTEVQSTMRALYAILPPPPLGEPETAGVLQVVIGSAFLFVGVALLPGVQLLLQSRTVRWLGKVSFALYLTHYPLLFTLSCAIFILLSANLSYWAAVAVTAVLGIAASFAVATGFERWIDRPAIILSRRLAMTRRVVRAAPKPTA